MAEISTKGMSEQRAAAYRLWRFLKNAADEVRRHPERCYDIVIGLRRAGVEEMQACRYLYLSDRENNNGN